MNLNIKKQLIITFVVIVFTIIFFGITNADERVQDLFFNFHTHLWMLDRNEKPLKFIFYTGIKKLLIFIGVCFLIAFFIPRFKEYKKGILIVVLSAIIVPVSIGFFKKITNMPCPKNIIRYGGVYPKTAVWQKYPKNFNKPKTRCWPAGHASGGFALMSLFFLFRRKRNKYIALIIGVLVGWAMGLYKMFIGDHFLSHTILTMEIAWFEILIITYFVNRFYKTGYSH